MVLEKDKKPQRRILCQRSLPLLFLPALLIPTQSCSASPSQHGTSQILSVASAHTHKPDSPRSTKMPSRYSYKITCHCSRASQTISPATPPPPNLTLCHCTQCRKTTGLLCASYLPISPPAHTTGLVAYRASQRHERLFCRTCGCHVFWRTDGGGDVSWAVATGVIEGLVGGDCGTEADDDVDPLEPQYARHINVPSTRDGGLAVFLPEINGRAVDSSSSFPSSSSPRSRWEDHFSPNDAVPPHPHTIVEAQDKDILPASCHCASTTFHIQRPNARSTLPRRGYTDLMYPFCSTRAEVAANLGDEKWWLRPPPEREEGEREEEREEREGVKPTRRYLAGTCACRSCRLVSGFEIQAWAFVPRANIFLHLPSSPSSSSLPPSSSSLPPSSSSSTSPFTILPLSFQTPLPPTLASYPSSPHVIRHFCTTCGATIFWRRDDAGDSSDVVDVSVGLLDAGAGGGARAVEWLDWWRGRVSFAEEAGTGRWGSVRQRAEGLVTSLEEGMMHTERS